ncbi:hypothetical protein NC653_040174 [Populus alba x Populus x berolinensis]|uniref:Uncharacterized protein n=1 Tax=Populus alba x Populus x berolinensis TaxID=444605 RepID=A0AAD6PRH7_9ROSI|nr:hypothetical protein NC653_040174 [Populus alba x Populus x berolinensis]
MRLFGTLRLQHKSMQLEGGDIGVVWLDFPDPAYVLWQCLGKDKVKQNMYRALMPINPFWDSNASNSVICRRTGEAWYLLVDSDIHTCKI